MNCIGVIVTYNRKELLLQNIRMLEKQSKRLNRIIIIDNQSTDGTKEYIMQQTKEYPIEVDYRYMDSNYGGAGGFYYGVKYAFEQKAEFIWLMDDDGHPFDNKTFEILFSVTEKLYQKNRMLFLNSYVTYDGRNLSFGFWNHINKKKQLSKIQKEAMDGIVYGVANPFNGTLISRETVEKIGYPRKEFFIKRDEWDYMNRAEENGVLIATVTNSLYYHPESKAKFKKIIQYYIPVFNDMNEEYYTIRNYCFSLQHIHRWKIVRFILIRVLVIIMYENHKLKRMQNLYQAVLDAFQGNMGRR